MKKTSLFAALLMVFFSVMSCKNNTKEETTATDAPAMENLEEVTEEVTETAEKFTSSLKWGDEEYLVTANPMGEQVEVTIQPMGAIADQEGWTYTYEGKVTNAEIGDLNGDNHAEVVVYIVSGDNNAGTVMAVSSNSGKSISQAYFAPTVDNAEINQGYNGGDEFAIVENTFSQRFPIYENGQPTGKMRQVSYKLVNGEAMRQFKVDKVDEY